MKLATLLFIALVSISSFGFSQTVSIGTQTWTTKNLDVATFRNGDAIPEAKTNEEWQAAMENNKPAWCYYNNDLKNGTKYGKLYNMHAVNDARGLAPTGFHIPSPQEWHVLSTFLGGYDVVDKKMKSNSGWLNSNGTNSSGFSGLPGGCRYYDGYFDKVGMVGYWWSSDMVQNGPYICGSELGYVNRLRSRGTTQSPSFSVRCVKN